MTTSSNDNYSMTQQKRLRDQIRLFCPIIQILLGVYYKESFIDGIE